jgi:hypothetical protein
VFLGFMKRIASLCPRRNGDNGKKSEAGDDDSALKLNHLRAIN